MVHGQRHRTRLRGGDLTVTITDNYGRVFEQVVSSELVIRPGEMRAFPTLSFTFSYGKANCIVVKKGETISFDAAPYYSFSKNLSVDSMKPVMTVKVENGEDVEAVETLSGNVFVELSSYDLSRIQRIENLVDI